MKEDIVLKHYTGQTSFTFLLYTDGLNLCSVNGRYFLAVSDADADTIELGDVVSFDATGRFNIGSMTVQTVTSGQLYQLTIIVDEAFLTDPRTTYPVIIDPTLEVKASTNSALIEDTTIYQGRPTTNGNWMYLHAGYYDNTYGVARTLVRLPGLIESDIFRSTSEYVITSAYFVISEATGTAPLDVYLHANTGSPNWTESGATWNNAGVVIGARYATASVPRNGTASFDIKSLLHEWQSGAKNPECGFVLKSSNETTLDKAFYSAEYSTSAYRPYVVVTYVSNGLSIITAKNYVTKGKSIKLNASGTTGIVTWESSNPSVATVSASGIVTGIKTGSVTISVSADGYATKSIEIFVTVPDGVYYIKNASTEKYLETSNTNVVVNSKKSSIDNRNVQLWKIKYISNGKYAIAPIANMNTLMAITSTQYAIVTSAAVNSGAVANTALWTLNGEGTGYTIKLNNLDSKTLQVPHNGSNSTQAYVAAQSTSSSYIWDFEEADGLFLWNNETGSLITESIEIEVEVGRTYTFENLGLTFLCNESTKSNVVGDSVNEQVAAFTGWEQITVYSRGETDIIAYATVGGVYYKQCIKLICLEYISVINFYGPSIEATDVFFQNVEAAVQYLNSIYKSDFYLEYVMDGDPQPFSSLSIAASTHLSTPCSTAQCGSDCTQHHNNVHRIAQLLYDSCWEPNHIVVVWDNSAMGTYCHEDDDAHTPVSFPACVPYVQENEVRVHLPIVYIMDYNVYAENQYVVEQMSVILAHEVAHTLWMDDVYPPECHFLANGDTLTVYRCIMQEAPSHVNLIASIYEKGEAALCCYCRFYLSNVIPSNAYES